MPPWRPFARGELQVLVATTVIEVGVDVANATVMVIEDADRFGIAQLHQLRGRVGPGPGTGPGATCWAGRSTRARRPVAGPRRQTDGFELAEVDRRQRGEGTISDRQKGRTTSSWRPSAATSRPVARPAEVAEEIIDGDPLLGPPASWPTRSPVRGRGRGISSSRAERLPARAHTPGPLGATESHLVGCVARACHRRYGEASPAHGA